MPVPTFPPTKDADLLTWSENYNTMINSGPEGYGLTLAQAAGYTTLHDAFENAYAVATNPNTNSKANINAKNVAKSTLLHGTGGAWDLVNIVQAFPGTNDTMRGELGLRISQQPTPAPVPKSAPDLSIVATMGRVIKVRLRDQDKPDNRGKPGKTQGATVLYAVADELPSDPSQWVYALNTSRTVFEVEIPAAVSAGSKVWLTAFWFNAKKQASPAATPEFTRVNDGLASAAA